MRRHDIWLSKAERDLKSAFKAAQSNDYDDDTLDAAVFHAQQCIEKALKAFLVYKKQPLKKTHDLEFLLKVCSDIDSEFMSLFVYIVNLDPYYFEFRYPTECADYDVQPSTEETLKALNDAKIAFEFIKNKIVSVNKPN